MFCVLFRTVHHRVSAGSLGNWVRMDGSEYSGIRVAPTPTEWAKRANTTLNLQIHLQLPSPSPRTPTRRTTQVSSLCIFGINLNCSIQLKPLRVLSFEEADLVEKSGHPTAMMLTSTVNLLKTLSLSAGIYADVLQTDATWTLCGLLRMLVESGANDKSGNNTIYPSASDHYSTWMFREVPVCVG